jgi:energy-coupling factor transport system ATP-binding protein
VTIELERVDVEFGAGLPGARLALKGLDISFRSDECVAIVGPTGAGKTTLLEVASGLLAPTRGRARADGGDRPLRSVAGLVYQFPELQFFEDTVFDDVAFGPRRLGLSTDAVRERVQGALLRSGLDPGAFAERDLATLSAGEKRRAAIAGILALERPFLLLDEPTAGLDPGTREGIVELLVAERSARGIVLVSHDLDLVDRVAERTVVMNAGVVVSDGRTRDVLSDVERLESMGLAPPVGYVLISRLQQLAPAEAAAVRNVLFEGRLADAER